MRLGLGLDMTGKSAAGGGGSTPTLVLLANFEGTVDSTSYTEESPFAEAAVFNGVSRLDNEQVKFGSTSGRFLSGTAQTIQFPSNIDWDAPGITIEFFRSRNAAQDTSDDIIFDIEGMIYLRESYDGVSLAELNAQYIGAAGTPSYQGTGAAGITRDIDTFYHFYWEFDFENNTAKGWANGTLIVDASSTATLSGTPDGELHIGNVGGGANGTSINGDMDALRIANGLLGLGGTVPTEAPNDDFTEARS